MMRRITYSWSDHAIWIMPIAALVIFSALIALTEEHGLTEADFQEELRSSPALAASLQAARACFGFKGAEGYSCAEQAAGRRCGADGHVFEGQKLYVSKTGDGTINTLMLYLFRCESESA